MYCLNIVSNCWNKTERYNNPFRELTAIFAPLPIIIRRNHSFYYIKVFTKWAIYLNALLIIFFLSSSSLLLHIWRWKKCIHYNRGIDLYRNKIVQPTRFNHFQIEQFASFLPRGVMLSLIYWSGRETFWGSIEDIEINTHYLNHNIINTFQ